MSDRARKRRSVLWIIVALGLGLALAPVAFGMFTRAPAGGVMIDDFEPYMTADEVATFRGYMEQIGAADAEWRAVLSADVDDASSFAAIAELDEGWAAIDADMADLLDRMEANLGNYAAVAALPPFALFPWFFVLPGLMIAGVAGAALWALQRDRPARGRVWALAGLGLAVLLAPVAFQMFSRAPQGAEMIDDFRPIMTRERVLGVQGYFVIMGAAEGQLRVDAIPQAVDTTGIDATLRYPAISRFSADWPTIVGDFSPMVATMSDNVDNFEGIDALPSFSLFPWFFVVPGLLVSGLALLAVRLGGRHHAIGPGGRSQARYTPSLNPEAEGVSHA